MKTKLFTFLLANIFVVAAFAQRFVHVPDNARVSLYNDFPRVAIAQWRQVSNNVYSVTFRLYRSKTVYRAMYNIDGKRLQLAAKAEPLAESSRISSSPYLAEAKR